MLSYLNSIAFINDESGIALNCGHISLYRGYSENNLKEFDMGCLSAYFISILRPFGTA